MKPGLRDIVLFTDATGAERQGRVVGHCAPGGADVYDITADGATQPTLYVPLARIGMVIERYVKPPELSSARCAA
jgi:hypothetical protein